MNLLQKTGPLLASILSPTGLVACQQGATIGGGGSSPRASATPARRARPCKRAPVPYVPVNGFIVGPAYLLVGSPKGEIEKVDFALMYSQIQALTTRVRMLDGMTAAQIAGVRNPAPPATRRRVYRT